MSRAQQPSHHKQILGDRYLVQSVLGKQSGRETLLAKDLQIEQPVVIKLVLFGPDFSWEAFRLFKREAETLKSLNHPAIPKYLDFFEITTDAGQGFALVQTYIKAKSLAAWVAGGRRFEERDLQPMARALLGILQYLHSYAPRVIHRDIKPSNILLRQATGDTPAKLYLVDFGAVQTVKQDGTLTVVGTYGYMPPEQFGGRSQPASDLYSLGATLVFLATGRHPTKLIQDNLQLEFEDLISFSNSFTQWLKRMTYAELDRRFKTAEEAIAQLQSTAHSQAADSFLIPSTHSTTTSVYSSSRTLPASIRADFKLQPTAQNLQIQCLHFRVREPFRMRVSLFDELASFHANAAAGAVYSLLVAVIFAMPFLSEITGVASVPSLFVLTVLTGWVHLFLPICWTKSKHRPAETIQLSLHRQIDQSFSLSLESNADAEASQGTIHFLQLPLKDIRFTPRPAPLNSSIRLIAASEGVMGSIERRYPGAKHRTNKLYMLKQLQIVGTRSELEWLNTHIKSWQRQP